MDNKLQLYHGSQRIIEKPSLGGGRLNNDFGLGFYCTDNEELAKEWACPTRHDGFLNKYELDISEARILDLTESQYNILNWLSILLKCREFDITNSVASQSKKYIISNFMPEIDNVDIIIGYRADDSYFKFAKDFLNNIISARDLDIAMRLGDLGLQYVLKSKRIFNDIKFTGYETANHIKYHYLRSERDKNSRDTYYSMTKNATALNEDIFAIDVLRGRIKNDDPRLRPQLP